MSAAQSAQLAKIKETAKSIPPNHPTLLSVNRLGRCVLALMLVMCWWLSPLRATTTIRHIDGSNRSNLAQARLAIEIDKDLKPLTQTDVTDLYIQERFRVWGTDKPTSNIREALPPGTRIGEYQPTEEDLRRAGPRLAEIRRKENAQRLAVRLAWLAGTTFAAVTGWL